MKFSTSPSPFSCAACSSAQPAWLLGCLRVRSGVSWAERNERWMTGRSPTPSPHVPPKTVTSLVPRGCSPAAGISHLKETRHQKKRIVHRVPNYIKRWHWPKCVLICGSSPSRSLFVPLFYFTEAHKGQLGMLILDNLIRSWKRDKLAPSSGKRNAKSATGGAWHSSCKFASGKRMERHKAIQTSKITA